MIFLSSHLHILFVQTLMLQREGFQQIIFTPVDLFLFLQWVMLISINTFSYRRQHMTHVDVRSGHLGTEGIKIFKIAVDPEHMYANEEITKIFMMIYNLKKPSACMVYKKYFSLNELFRICHVLRGFKTGTDNSM